MRGVPEIQLLCLDGCRPELAGRRAAELGVAPGVGDGVGHDGRVGQCLGELVCRGSIDQGRDELCQAICGGIHDSGDGDHVGGGGVGSRGGVPCWRSRMGCQWGRVSRRQYCLDNDHEGVRFGGGELHAESWVSRPQRSDGRGETFWEIREHGRFYCEADLC